MDIIFRSGHLRNGRVVRETGVDVVRLRFEHQQDADQVTQRHYKPRGDHSVLHPHPCTAATARCYSPHDQRSDEDTPGIRGERGR